MINYLSYIYISVTFVSIFQANKNWNSLNSITEIDLSKVVLSFPNPWQSPVISEPSRIVHFIHSSHSTIQVPRTEWSGSWHHHPLCTVSSIHLPLCQNNLILPELPYKTSIRINLKITNTVQLVDIASHNSMLIHSSHLFQS